MDVARTIFGGLLILAGFATGVWEFVIHSADVNGWMFVWAAIMIVVGLWLCGLDPFDLMG